MKHFLIIMTLMLSACSQITNVKTFNSPEGWFKFDQPIDWYYEYEEEGTHLFYNTVDWNGSFRIMPLKIKGETEQSVKQKMKNYFNDELNEKEGARIVNLGNKETVHYSEKIKQDNRDLQIDYWVFGLNTTLFICSFTIDYGTENDKKVRKEIELCHSALASIKLDN